MKDHAKVDILVLNWNGKGHLPVCLGSLRNLTYPDYRVILVDNGSTDGSREFVSAHFPEVEILNTGANIGFPAAMNRGIEQALEEGVKYVALLNNDTESDPGWVTEMVKVAEADPSIGAVASRMMYFQNRRIINGIGGAMNRFAVGRDRGNGRVFDPGKNKDGDDILYVCGGACLLRLAALKKAGPFDPQYIHYLEDVDLCLRLWEAGFRVVTAPKAVVHHKFSATLRETSPRKNALALRARLRFVLKFFPPRELLLRTLPPMLREEWRRNRLWFRQTEFKRNLLQVRALLAALGMLPKILIHRLRNRKDFWEVFCRLADSNVPPPKIFHFRWDYKRTSGEEGDFPSRLLMGVNDTLLGDGWYPREGKGPRFRWTSNCATCFLKGKRGTPSVLQILAGQSFSSRRPPRLRPYLNGVELGELPVAAGVWRTYHFKLIPEKTVSRVDLRVEDYRRGEEIGEERDLGVQVVEVSLLPEGSVFLREGSIFPGEQ